MNTSDEIGLLALALSKAQGEIDDAAKGAENPYYKSKYADLAAVRSVIREPLANNELSIVQLPRSTDGGVEVETMLIHSSGQFISSKLFMPAAKGDAHGLGSAITYARRYSLMSILCLATEDDDGNAAVDSVKKSAPMNGNVQSALKDLTQAAAKGSASLTEIWNALPQNIRTAIPPAELAKIKAVAAEANKKDKSQ